MNPKLRPIMLDILSEPKNFQWLHSCAGIHKQGYPLLDGQ